MSKKSFDFFRTRAEHLSKCWKHGRNHWIVVMIGAFATAYGWVTTFGPQITLPAWAKQESWPKLSLSWVLVIVLVTLFFTLLEGSYRLHQSTANDDVLPSDPRIYFRLIDHRQELARRTPIELHNRGGSIAHKIVIHPVDMDRRRATFKEIDFLDVGAKIEVIPEISGMSPIFKYDLLNFLRGGANDSGKGTEKEYRVSVFATYKDQTERRCFKVYFDIVYHLLNDALYREKSLISDVKPLFEIRHIKTVRIPPIQT
jgi:hypothetical protein